MKYEVGDRVRVISDLVEDDPRFDDVGVDPEMVAFSGKTVTIKAVIDDKKYLIAQDGEYFAWTDGMFYGIHESEEPKKMTISEIEKELGYAVEVVLESEANNEE